MPGTILSAIYLHPSIEGLFPSGSKVDEGRQARIGNGLGSVLLERLAGADELNSI